MSFALFCFIFLLNIFLKKVVEAHKFCDNTYIESAFKKALSRENWVRFTWDLWQ